MYKLVFAAIVLTTMATGCSTVSRVVVPTEGSYRSSSTSNLRLEGQAAECEKKSTQRDIDTCHRQVLAYANALTREADAAQRRTERGVRVARDLGRDAIRALENQRREKQREADAKQRRALQLRQQAQREKDAEARRRDRERQQAQREADAEARRERARRR